MTTDAPLLIYGTCVALGTAGALLRGPSGSGKSDLALRFVLESPQAVGAVLISDDQLLLERRGERLFARPPTTIAGKIEVRGVGIVNVPHRPLAELRLVIDLTEPDAVPRLPDLSTAREDFLGIRLPVLALAPFEASAVLKLRLALQALA